MGEIIAIMGLAVIPVAILTPSFVIAGVNLRLENLLALLITPVLVRQVVRREYKINLFDLGFIFLAIAFLTTIAYSYLFRSIPFNPRDFFDVFRIFNYYLLYRFCLYAFSLEGQLQRFKKVFIWSYVVVILVALAQYFDAFQVNDLLRYYTSYFHARGVLKNGRVIGTFGHTNEFAIFTGVFVIFVTAQLLFKDLKDKIEARKALALKVGLMFFSFFCLFATMSRSVLVSAFAGLSGMLFFYLVFSREKYKITRTLLVVGLLILTSFSAFGLIKYQADSINRINVLDRLETGFNEIGGKEEEGVLESISFSKRLAQWVQAVDVISENPVLGYGPSKATKGQDERPRIVENEYLGLMMNYGALGLMAYMYFYLIMLWVLFRALVRQKEALPLSYSYWVLGAIGAIIFYNIFLGVFFRTQSFNIIMIIAGLTIAINARDVDLTEA